MGFGNGLVIIKTSLLAHTTMFKNLAKWIAFFGSSDFNSHRESSNSEAPQSLSDLITSQDFFSPRRVKYRSCLKC